MISITQTTSRDWFPVQNSVARSRKISQSIQSYRERLKHKRILVVEDELLISMELASELEDCDAIVVGPFRCVEDVLGLSDKLKADAAILDVNLNGVMVYPIADLLQTLSMPFVFQTGNPNSEILSSLYPGVPVVEKPVDPRVLLGKVADLIS